MKIGLITYFIGFNYGGLLQAYATMEVLRFLGHDVTMIYYHQRWAVRRSWFRLDSWLSKSPKRMLERWKYNFNTPKYNYIFGQMLKFHKPLTKYYGSNLNKLKNDPPIFDCYITGSDQVWNGHCHWSDYAAYFLPFAPENAKRIAYAASLGGRPFADADLPKIIPLLKKYQFISCREKSGMKYLQTLGFTNTVWAPDPTLLLEADQYQKLLAEGKTISPGLVYYVLRKPSDNFIKLASNVAEMFQNVTNIALEDFRLKKAKNILATVPDFVKIIKNSEAVFTNSFHGVLFSIIFHRQFIYVRFGSDNMAANDRLECLLGELMLQDRMIEEDINPLNAVALLNTPINWDEVDPRIDQIRQRGYDFLEKALAS